MVRLAALALSLLCSVLAFIGGAALVAGGSSSGQPVEWERFNMPEGSAHDDGWYGCLTTSDGVPYRLWYARSSDDKTHAMSLGVGFAATPDAGCAR